MFSFGFFLLIFISLYKKKTFKNLKQKLKNTVNHFHPISCLIKRKIILVRHIINTNSIISSFYSIIRSLFISSILYIYITGSYFLILFWVSASLLFFLFYHSQTTYKKKKIDAYKKLTNIYIYIYIFFFLFFIFYFFKSLHFLPFHSYTLLRDPTPSRCFL